MNKTALITGITGQDGSYLSELLLTKGYVVHGMVRRASMFNRSRVEHLRTNANIYGKQLFFHYADLHDTTTMRRLIHKLRPDELYHLASQSHVGLSFEIPESTFDEVARGTLALLEICRDLDYPVRFYHASSSEVFGKPDLDNIPQSEDTPFRPQSPYGCAKAFATDLCHVYRDSYQVFVCSGLAYNHESPRRGENFVTRKITVSAARIKAGLQDTLVLGNLSATRDWGYAKEYVEAMWRMLQQDKPADYIIATGLAYAVRDFIAAAFAALDIRIVFRGGGESEVGLDADTGKILVQVSPQFFRPADPAHLIGNPRRIEHDLGWKAVVTTPELAALMAEADWQAVAATKLTPAIKL